MATVNKQAVAAAFGQAAAIRNMMNCSGAAPIYCCASWRAAICAVAGCGCGWQYESLLA